MARLSNFLRSHGNSAAEPVEINLATAAEQRQALAILLGNDGKLATEAQVNEFVRYAASRQIDLNNLWVSRRGQRLIWAVLPIPSPGRTALLFLPAGGWDGSTSAPLVQAASEWCRSVDAHLTQLLLEPHQHAAREALARLQFREMAELIYLQASVSGKDAFPVLPPGHRFETYNPDSHQLFVAAISGSYEQSLDCPALSGMRDIEDVVDGHKAAGEFDPDFWFVLLRDDAPQGVLLLNRIPNGYSNELTYLGVCPAGRRRGLGTLLVRQALAATVVMEKQSLTLAVDSRNEPALRLYYKFGFRQMARKVAMIRNLRDVAVSG